MQCAITLRIEQNRQRTNSCLGCLESFSSLGIVEHFGVGTGKNNLEFHEETESYHCSKQNTNIVEKKQHSCGSNNQLTCEGCCGWDPLDLSYLMPFWLKAGRGSTFP